jgi:tetratricopeptide (TPR) repeat protein
VRYVGTAFRADSTQTREVVPVAAGGELSVLRLTDRQLAGGPRSVTVMWHAAGYAPRTVTVPIDVTIDHGMADLIRWYLEEYAEFPSDPASALAVRAEGYLKDLGERLFMAVFGAGDAAEIWGHAVTERLDRVRVEIDSDPADVPGLPWELLRKPGSTMALVLATGQFVRIHRETAGPVPMPQPADAGLRVLLVICRPGGRDDVPFRSVASRLVRGGIDQLTWLHLDVLRPATFARLGEMLRAAADNGQPYHIVHFDGHGTYLDTVDIADPDDETQPVSVSTLQYGASLAGPTRPGRHGYLLFEDPRSSTNQQLVDGPTLACLLVRHRVPVLVLNACRSAWTEPQIEPEVDSAASGSVHDRIRAYGSLAAEVADAGVAGVVAMRYNVYVVTATQFVADLYLRIGAGHSLGEAATAARQQLADDPIRRIGETPIALQDWVVPVIYETRPLILLKQLDHPDTKGTVSFQVPTAKERLKLQETTPTPRGPGNNAPVAPEVGFFGRDETLLALDRAFDRSQLVLLHALAGAGKTSTVAEFARWYSATGGLHHPQIETGPVLWNSFEHHTPLDRLLDAVGTKFAGLLEASGVFWSAVTDSSARKRLVLNLLAQIPVLWIWDNVEPVAGFPDGTPSSWTLDEQAELRHFLYDLKTKTLTKVLITSRRDEQHWLGLLPTRLSLPPMPMRERLQLAHAIATQLDHQTIGDVDWRPLLRFTGGNPLTITVATRQAIREYVTSKSTLGNFLERVTAGKAALENPDDVALGRSGSLAASLDYGFTTAFTEPERAVLAILHLFRAFVDVDVLRLMGDPEAAGDDAVPMLSDLDRDTAVRLLDRAADIGLLTPHGSGYYGIHPALPWYFHTLHSHHLGPDDAPAAAVAARAYVCATAVLSRFYYRQFEAGATAMLMSLRAEEGNFLHAVDLAQRHHLPTPELGVLIGLHRLYAATGRDTEWDRLVERILSDYLTPDDQPRPGLEGCYAVITNWRVRSARHRRDLTAATQLQSVLTAWTRKRAQAVLGIPTSDLSDEDSHHLRSLAVSEQDLGQLLAEQGDHAAALPHHQSHYDLNARIKDTAGQAAAASGLGNVYLLLRNFDQAQYWYRHSLDLIPEEDRIGRATAHGSLANLAFERFELARAADAPEAELIDHFSRALAGHHKVLDLLPSDHHQHRAVAHNQLGNAYAAAGEVGTALRHYQQSIHHKEARGDIYGAAVARINIAVLLGNAGRPSDALHYARAAHATYSTLGVDSSTEAHEAAGLIWHLEQQG